MEGGGPKKTIKTNIKIKYVCITLVHNSMYKTVIRSTSVQLFINEPYMPVSRLHKSIFFSLYLNNTSAVQSVRSDDIANLLQKCVGMQLGL